MKLFIVGGAGYIGSHMVKIAHRAGHSVVTLDNLSTGHRDSVLYGKFEFCDILDAERLNILFSKHSPDAVIHFGAFSIVEESIIDPYKYYQNNVFGTLSLLKAMIDNNCNKFIFSSTAAVFGNNNCTPITEDNAKEPINPYGKSKLMVEHILKDFESCHGLKYISFRYFNAAGQDPEGELCERHNPETHLLPILMQAVKGHREVIEIYGTNYDTKDGTCVRDYIHVNDIVNAHLKGLDYINNKESKSTEINLGNGNGFSVKEVIEKVKEIYKKDFKVIEKDIRVGDSAVLVASCRKANSLLGFKPYYDDLESIIKTLK